MRVRWRGLELPGRVVRDEAVSNDSFARFVIEPFEQGFGTTIGNSLRRVLLSSLEGAAVTSVKIAGVSHEFRSIDGVLEDVTDIILNIKGIVLKLTGAEYKTVVVSRNKPGEVRAGDIVADPAVFIANPDHKIATLTSAVPFRVEMAVHTGRGYATINDNRSPEQELGIIPIDSIFSPVLRVRYRTEHMRVGQRTNFDRLIMEVWTKGTVRPEDALLEAGLILRKHLNPFVMYHELGDQVVTAARPVRESEPSEGSAMAELLASPVATLELSVRASNCLEAAKVLTLRDLVTKTESDLLRCRSFGKTSLHEVLRKLSAVGLTLGMKFGDDEGDENDSGDRGEADVADVAPRFGNPAARGSDLPGPSSGSMSRGGSGGPMEVFTMGD